MNDDTIYRQVVLNLLIRCAIPENGGSLLYQSIKQLPSAEKRGKWIAVENDVDYYPFMCSECYETVTKKTNYCPRCGSHMNMEDIYE